MFKNLTFTVLSCSELLDRTHHVGVVATRVHLSAGLGEEGLGVLVHLFEDGQRVHV